MAITTTVKFLAANPQRGHVYFSNGFTYNYKTGQWTDTDAYSSYAKYNIHDGTSSIGLIVSSSGHYGFQEQTTDGAVQTAVIETGAQEIMPGQRMRISGVRPIANGGTYAVRVGTQDNVGDSVSWSASTSVTTRTGKADFRETGRYARVELTVTGGFTTLLGVDVDGMPTGRV